MKQRLLLWSVLFALVATLTVGTTVSAKESTFGSLTGSAEPAVSASGPSSSCDGLTDYGDAMLKIGKRWIKGMQHDGLADRSTRTFTSAEWDAYANRAARLRSDLRAIDPPAFAAPWHTTMVEFASLKINFARSASLLGFDYTAELLAKSVAATSTEVDQARLAAAAACSDFAVFSQNWDLLDGRPSAAADSTDS